MTHLVIFDLDGTLTDSKLDIARALSHAIRSIGHEVADESVFYPLIGATLEETFTAVLPPHRHNRIAEAVAAYKAYYPDHCADATRLFDGVPEGLRALQARGFTLAVATTKRTWMADRVLTLLGIRGCFAHVQGTDDFPYKPDPEIIRRVRAALAGRCDDRRTWMVGDTPRDIETGRRAGVRTAGVLYGYGDADALRRAGPEVLAASFRELVDRLLDGAAAVSG